jgi:hypothetical protein
MAAEGARWTAANCIGADAYARQSSGWAFRSRDGLDPENSGPAGGANHLEHERSYGYCRTEQVQVVNLRLRAGLRAGPPSTRPGECAKASRRSARSFGPGRGMTSAGLARGDLTKVAQGPLIVEGV